MIRIVEKLEKAIQTIILVCCLGNVTKRKNHFRYICVENRVMALKVKFDGCLSWFIFLYWSELAE